MFKDLLLIKLCPVDAEGGHRCETARKMHQIFREIGKSISVRYGPYLIHCSPGKKFPIFIQSLESAVTSCQCLFSVPLFCNASLGNSKYMPAHACLPLRLDPLTLKTPKPENS